VSNCTFDTSDDSICLQASRPDRPCRDVVVSNCLFVSQWAGIRIGLLSMGDFENIAVSNCVFRDIRDAGLKIQMCEGGTMQNLVFGNCVRQPLADAARWRDSQASGPPRSARIRRPASGVRRVGDPIPFAGVYARHVRDLRLSNLRIAAVGEELRPAIFCDDVCELAVTGLRLSATFTAPETVRLNEHPEPARH